MKADAVVQWVSEMLSWIFIDMWVITYPAVLVIYALFRDENNPANIDDYGRTHYPNANFVLTIWGVLWMIWFTSWLVDIRKAVVG
jgi:hypothetical protein